MLTPQEYFDKAVRHFHTMPRQAKVQNEKYVEPACVYQSDDGNRCIIGQFIPDNHAGLQHDGGIGSLIETYPTLIRYVLPLGDRNYLTLAAWLQTAHDNGSNWDETGFIGWDAIQEIAIQFALKFKTLNELIAEMDVEIPELESTTV